MSAATQLIWALAGSPDPIESAARLLTTHKAPCGVCGDVATKTAPIDKALGANFTDRSMFRDPSPRVCTACLWCCSGKPPATLRMWSIIAAPGHDLGPSHEKAWLQNTPGLLLTNRANPGPIADWLANPGPGQWSVTIAVSGQKHVVPYANTNHGSDQWTIRYENTTITSTPDEWTRVHAAAKALRQLGVPAEDVLTGTPRYLKTLAQLKEWTAHNAALTKYHNAPILSLALWTLTKGTMS